MASLNYREPIKLSNCKEIDEKKIKQFIIDNPKVLGLGDNIEFKSKEVKQVNGGYLDLLLEQNDETRYEVEVQLGPTNPDHIIRTIEYWNNERRRNNRYDHIPVLVAEEITGRFQEVISLFAGTLPIIAIQMSVFKEANGDFGVLFTKIFDFSEMDNEDDLTNNVVTPEQWEKKSTKTMMDLVNKMFEDLPLNIDGVALNYVKNYIGITVNDISNNFISFVPKQSYVKVRFKSDENEDVEKDFSDNGIDIIYCARPGRKDYTLRVKDFNDYLKAKPLLQKYISQLEENE